MGHEFTITDERFEALCSSMDADGSGTVDFEELLLMLGVLKKGNDKIRRRQKYDDDDEDWEAEARTSMIGFIPMASHIETHCVRHFRHLQRRIEQGHCR